MPGRTAPEHSRGWPPWSATPGLSEHTVRTCLNRLDAAGIIRPCDPGIVAARIKHAYRRP
jgi:predicted transcriptional regulator